MFLVDATCNHCVYLQREILFHQVFNCGCFTNANMDPKGLSSNAIRLYLSCCCELNPIQPEKAVVAYPLDEVLILIQMPSWNNFTVLDWCERLTEIAQTSYCNRYNILLLLDVQYFNFRRGISKTCRFIIPKVVIGAAYFGNLDMSIHIF